jgi:hypothetical protein
MSYTGVGVVGSHVAHQATAHDDSGMVAARDIVRRNALGQQVIVVPAGRPIPAGMDTAAGEAVPAPPPDTPHVEYHHRPEPYLTGPERQNLYTTASSGTGCSVASHSTCGSRSSTPKSLPPARNLSKAPRTSSTFSCDIARPVSRSV